MRMVAGRNGFFLGVSCVYGVWLAIGSEVLVHVSRWLRSWGQGVVVGASIVSLLQSLCFFLSRRGPSTKTATSPGAVSLHAA